MVLRGFAIALRCTAFRGSHFLPKVDDVVKKNQADRWDEAAVNGELGAVVGKGASCADA